MQDPRHRDPDRRLHLARWARARPLAHLVGERRDDQRRHARVAASREVVEPPNGAPSATPTSSNVSRAAVAAMSGSAGSRRPPGKAICPDHGSPSRSRALDEQELRLAAGRRWKTSATAAAQQVSSAPGSERRAVRLERARICGIERRRRSAGPSAESYRRAGYPAARWATSWSRTTTASIRLRCCRWSTSSASSGEVRVVVPGQRAQLDRQGDLALGRARASRGRARRRRDRSRSTAFPPTARTWRSTRCSTRRPSSSSRV